MTGRLGAALLVAGAATLTDCAIGDYCTEGAKGCVDPGCHDGVRNGDETDVDCGGSCGPCATGAVCAAPSDCAAGRCAGGRCCEAPCGLWTSAFGGLGPDAATDVAALPDGGLFAVGAFSGIVDLGGGPLASAGKTDAFVLRLDGAGKHVWSVRLGAGLDDAAARVVVTAAGHPVVAIRSADPALDLGGGVLAGAGEQDFYLVELDGAGKHVWSRGYPGRVDPGGLAVAPGGDLVVVASFYEVDLGAAGKLASKGGIDVLLLHLDPGGEPRWAKRFGDAFHDMGRDVAIDAEGAHYLLSRYSLSPSFGKGVLPYSGGWYSYGIAKLDAAGAHVWSRGFRSQPPVDQFPISLAADDHGGVWFTGAFHGSIDFGEGPVVAGVGGSALVAQLDAASGDVRWARGFGENSAEIAGIVPDGAGGAVVSGRYRGNVDFGGGVALSAGLDQLFVARLDASGAAAWARGEEGVVAGGRSSALAAAPGGDRFFLAGGFRGRIDTGADARVSAGGDDAFVAALLP